MMNLAILIGVSEYYTLDSLPSCKNDVQLMEKLIESSSKYEDSLILHTDTTSEHVKEEISKFIKKYKGEDDIDEVFFYFSGHGNFENEEFYYALSDFKAHSLNQTTLKNTDIDTYIRSLNPTLTVKVVDACQSGVRYVKQTKDFVLSKVMEEAKETFNDCFFMFSSSSEQSSFANENISFFTESFIKAILEHSGSNVRYNRICDYISDDFGQRNTDQNPFFIIQGDLTYEFLQTNENIKGDIQRLLEKIGVSSEEGDKGTVDERSIIDIIRGEAQYYCKNIEEVESIFDKMETWYKDFELNGIIGSLYDISFDFNNNPLNRYPNINNVAKSLVAKEKEYFIDIKYLERSYRVKKKRSISDSFLAIQGQTIKDEYETVKKVEPGYLELTENVPFNNVEITLSPKEEFPNIPKMNFISIFVFSKVNVDIFYSLNVLLEKEWFTYELGDVDWLFVTSKLKDEQELKVVIDNLKEQFFSFANAEITKRFREKFEEVQDEEDLVQEDV